MSVSISHGYWERKCKKFFLEKFWICHPLQESWHMEEWLMIPDIQGYSISSWGRVRNDRTGHILALSENQYGVVHVSMSEDGEQIRRAVAHMVAAAFLIPPNEAFDTPINLDGDRRNNRLENLVWRPRWFAVKYNQQFEERILVNYPIEEIKTGRIFKNSREVATTYGLLEKDLVLSMAAFTYVWPTYQRFQIVYVDTE